MDPMHSIISYAILENLGIWDLKFVLYKFKRFVCE